RAGTENVPGIVGFGKAAEIAMDRINEMARVRQLREKLEEGILQIVAGAKVNGQGKLRLPNTLNVTLPGIRGESLVIALDQIGITLSSGSAGPAIRSRLVLCWPWVSQKKKPTAPCAFRSEWKTRRTKLTIPWQPSGT
ncbi:MAG: aminotransferase class V-fold PLP-dependent enzyme, partial [Nitrospira sp.]|nr:aminotransferase class V-fold PLP-dependent enzyme [Nitrospira sp.]